LDKSYPEQYFSFMGNVFQGNLGTSFQYKRPVSELYLQRLPASLQLAAGALIVAMVIGIPVGILSAVKLNTWWDSSGKLAALLGLSIPNFWLGLLLLIVFGLVLGVLPVAGKGGFTHLVLPSIALGWYFAGSFMRLTRSSMLDVLGSEYIKLARLKGLPDHVVVAKHAFKNALIPVLTWAGLYLVLLLNTAVVIEVIYAYPGVGSLLFSGIFQRDFPLVQGAVIIIGVMIVIANLVVDILYAYIDPRIRLTR
jgi:peptide/nickel transport system permease protein